MQHYPAPEAYHIGNVLKYIARAPHKGRLIWVNQVVDTPVKMNIGLNFINSMKPETKVSFDKTKGMAGLAESLVDAGEAISKSKEFVLEFFKNDKGYDQYTIETVFELED